VSTVPAAPDDTPPLDVKQVRSNLWGRVVASGIWVVGARVCGILSTVLTNVVLARQLVPEAFGDFVVICSIANAASLVAMVGMNIAVVRFVAEQLASDNVEEARHVFWLCFRLAGYGTLITALVMFAGICSSGSRLLDLDDPVRVALLTACVLSIQAFCNMSAAALRGLGEMRYSGVLGGQGGVVGPMANTVFLVLVSGFVLITKLTLVVALSVYLLAFVIALVAGSHWIRCTAHSVFKSSSVSSIEHRSPRLLASTLLAACLPMLVVQILGVASRQGGLWIAGVMCSQHELPLYAGANRAIQLVSIPMNMVSLSLMAFVPLLRAQQRLPELERILRVSAGWAAVPSFLALAAFLIIPAPILEVFLGSSFRDAALLLSILSLGQFVVVWTGASELALIFSGFERAASIVNAAAVLAIVVAGPFVVDSHGAVGLAVFSTATTTAQSIALWLLTRRLVGIWTHATPMWGLKGVGQS